MKITKNILLKELQLFDPNIFQAEEKNTTFESIIFFDKNQFELNKDCLYVCNLNDLKDSTSDVKDCNFVCTCDIREAKDISGEKKCSIIAVNSKKIKFSELINKLYYTFNKYKDWDNKLNSIILRNLSIQDLIDESEEFFDNPIYFVDVSFRVIGNTNTIPSNNEFFNNIILKRTYSEESIKSIIERKLLVNEDMFKNLSVINPPNFSNAKQYIRSIYSNNSKCGTFLQVCCNREPQKFDEDLINYFLSKIECLLTWNGKNSNTKQYRYDFFIRDLIDKTYPSEAILNSRSEIVKMPYEGKYMLYVIEFKYFSTETANYFLEIFRNCSPFYRVTVYEQNIVIINMMDKQNYNEDILKHKFDCLKSFLKKYDAYIGISGIFHGLTYTADEYKKVSAAIKIGRMMDESKRIYWYRDYFIYHILLLSSEKVSLDCLYYRKLNKLIDIDRKYNTDNFYILKVFLENDRNVTETAKLVNLHRNSVPYRINKIEEILNISLDSYEMRMRILLSYYILNLKEKLTKTDETAQANQTTQASE